MIKFLLVLAIVARAFVAQGCLTCRVVVCWPHPSCPAMDVVQTFLPHDDCTRFYKCDKGIKCEMNCPAGLHWSVHLVRCEWPHIANCQSTTAAPIPTIPVTTPPAPITTTEMPIPTIPITTPPAPITTTPTDIPTIPITTPPAPITTTPTDIPTIPITTTLAPTSPPIGPTPSNCIPDFRCPLNENPNNPTVLPHERDCKYFYICANGQRCPRECPLGLHFSVALGRCEWPTTACCDPNVPCTGTTVPPPAPVTPISAVSTCAPDARCPTNANPLHLRHETDCAQFYKCTNGQRCPMQCKTGEHFSIALGRCDWPNIACCDSRVPCQSGPVTSAPPTNTSTSCQPDIGCPQNDDPANPLHLPNPTSCSSFYKCQAGRACLIPCPTGQHWSRHLNRCDWPNVARCDAVIGL